MVLARRTRFVAPLLLASWLAACGGRSPLFDLDPVPAFDASREVGAPLVDASRPEVQPADALRDDARADAASNPDASASLRCPNASQTVPVFNDRLRIDEGAPRGAWQHVLNRTLTTSAPRYQATWVGLQNNLERRLFGARGGVLARQSVTDAQLSGARVDAVSEFAPPAVLLRREAEVPTSAFYVSDSTVTTEGLSLGRFFGGGAMVQSAAVLTTAVTSRAGGGAPGTLEAQRLAADGTPSPGVPVASTGRLLRPMLFSRGNSLWTAWVTDAASPPSATVLELDPGTLAPRGRPSAPAVGGSCDASAGFHAALLGNVPVTVESCAHGGLRLTVFWELGTTRSTVRVMVREEGPATAPPIHARVASNGVELAVVWQEPSAQDLSWQLFSSQGEALTARLLVPSPEQVVAGTEDLFALSGWGVLWSTTAGTYVARMGPCGVDAPTGP